MRESFPKQWQMILNPLPTVCSLDTDSFLPLHPHRNGSQVTLDGITLAFTRLVLGVQLVLAGVQLPSRYLKVQWRPLALLLGPIMTTM